MRGIIVFFLGQKLFRALNLALRTTDFSHILAKLDQTHDKLARVGVFRAKLALMRQSANIIPNNCYPTPQKSTGI